MLAVDRHELAAATGLRLAYEMACHNERFLIRERNALAMLERGERCVEPRCPNHRVDHDVDVIARRGRDQAIAATTPRAVISGAVVHQTDKRRPELDLLLVQERSVAERGECGDLESIALSAEHS
jgi:hypothetical protein